MGIVASLVKNRSLNSSSVEERGEGVGVSTAAMLVLLAYETCPHLGQSSWWVSAFEFFLVIRSSIGLLLVFLSSLAD